MIQLSSLTCTCYKSSFFPFPIYINPYLYLPSVNTFYLEASHLSIGKNVDNQVGKAESPQNDGFSLFSFLCYNMKCQVLRIYLNVYLLLKVHRDSDFSSFSQHLCEEKVQQHNSPRVPSPTAEVCYDNHTLWPRRRLLRHDSVCVQRVCPDGGVRGERLSCAHVCWTCFLELPKAKIKSSHEKVLLVQS